MNKLLVLIVWLLVVFVLFSFVRIQKDNTIFPTRYSDSTDSSPTLREPTHVPTFPTPTTAPTPTLVAESPLSTTAWPDLTSFLQPEKICHIVTMCTTPSRVLDFMTHLPAKDITLLVLNLPDLFRNKDPYPEIPLNLSTIPIHIVRHRKDVGPHLRLALPDSLIRDDCIYTTLDDDVTQKENWISTIQSKYQPGTILAGSIFRLPDCWNFTDADREKMNPLFSKFFIFEGWQTYTMDGGTLRRIRTLGFATIPSTCKRSDDVWFSFTAYQMRIPVDDSLGQVTEPKGGGADNLSAEQNHCTSYVKCLEEMLNYDIN